MRSAPSASLPVSQISSFEIWGFAISSVNFPSILAQLGNKFLPEFAVVHVRARFAHSPVEENVKFYSEILEVIFSAGQILCQNSGLQYYHNKILVPKCMYMYSIVLLYYYLLCRPIHWNFHDLRITMHKSGKNTNDSHYWPVRSRVV